MNASPHIPYDKLVDIADGRMPLAQRRESMSHVSACSRCATQLEKLHQVINVMRSDKAEDAPRDVVANAINMFRHRAISQEPSLLRRIAAALTFDSFTATPAFGVRSGQTGSRQLIYSTEGNDIDLRLTPQENMWVVAGQVLRSDCSGGTVSLEGGTYSATAPLNDLCEFNLNAVQSGDYVLRVRLADIEIEIPELKLKA